MTRRADVRRTYDLIAPHFALTRDSPWPEVTQFLDARSGRTGLDLGCGNARHLELLAERVTTAIGLDISGRILGTARRRAREHGFPADLVQADAAGLPFRTGAIDLCVYIATIHHLPSRSLRLASLAELDRVLAPGGEALVSVWSTAHDKFEDGPEFDTTVGWTLPDGTTVPRYYHIYDGEGFKRDLEESSLGTVDRFESAGNWFAVVRSSTSSARS